MGEKQSGTCRKRRSPQWPLCPLPAGNWDGRKVLRGPRRVGKRAGATVLVRSPFLFNLFSCLSLLRAAPCCTGSISAPPLPRGNAGPYPVFNQCQCLKMSAMCCCATYDGEKLRTLSNNNVDTGQCPCTTTEIGILSRLNPNPSRLCKHDQGLRDNTKRLAAFLCASVNGPFHA